MKKVLIFDGRSRAALQIVRSFAKRGFRIYVGNESRICSSFFSKYVYKRIKYPPTGTIEFEEYMLNIIEKGKFDFIVPVRDDTTLFCAKYKNLINKYSRVLISNYNTILIGRDKGLTFEIAKKFDFPIPETKSISNAKELLKYIGNYPIILKPAISSGSRGLYKINNYEELKKISNKLFDDYNEYLIQEFIPSDNTVAVNILLDENSNLVAGFSYKRVREYPRSGGPSVLRESTYNPDLIELCSKFMKRIGWIGVAMLEFRVDSRDNKPKLMEINPRYWGSLALPIFAGIDFPYLSYKVASGETVAEVIDYEVGVKARWLFMGDFLWLLSSKNKLKDLIKFFDLSDKKTTYDIFSIRDFGPTIGAILEGFMYLIDKKKRNHVFSRGNKLN